MHIITTKVLKIYTASNGKTPFLDWLHKKIKDKTLRARIRLRLDRLELGHFGDAKSLGDGLYELRLMIGPGYRIYFVEENDVIVILLCAGDKSTQAKDIKLAKLLVNELKGLN